MIVVAGCAEPLSRRAALRTLAAALIPLQVPGTAFQPQQPDSLAGRGATGTLRDPTAAGRPRQPTDARENDAEIKRIEQQLACNCGCTLDVFTCRTTDFTCTYSPALHREVLALRDRGMSARQILDAFVAKYGEKALMAPEPRGFNLWGYLLPGVLVGGAAIALAAILRRREAKAVAAVPAPASGQGVSATPEELERLNRALEEVPD
jgi:cytochrome c-type biogenesis protein CcmH